jgi:glycosyltransferase involved in cell wall biosynthesis
MAEEIIFLAPLPALRKRTRLVKMASVILGRGHRIRFFGWERDVGESVRFAWQQGGVVETSLLRGGGYASDRARALYPLWMAKVFWRVLRLERNKLLFCLGWETAFPALLASYFTGARIVFDDADRFSMIVRLPKTAGWALRRLEQWASRSAALHIIPGFSRYEWAHDRMVVLRNSPLEADFRATEESRLTRPEAEFVLYANGWVGESRGAPVFLQLLEIAEARGLDLNLVIAGRVDGPSARSLIKHPRVTFLGEVAQREALAWYRVCDAVLTFYDPSIVINRKAESNKWGDAVYFGCPIIVNVEVETAAPLIDVGAAFAVPYSDAAALADLVERLANCSDTLSAAARGAAALRPEYPVFDCQFVEILTRLRLPHEYMHAKHQSPSAQD